MPANIKKVERALDIVLPKQYVAALKLIAKTCTDWPVDYVSFGERLFTDVDQLIAINQDCRERPSKYIRTPASYSREWPHHLLIFGGRSDTMFGCVDTSDPNGKLLQIHEKRLEESHWSTFKELTDSITFQYKQIRKAVRQRDSEHRQRTKAERNAENEIECPDLVEEGRALARPALRLSAEGDKYVAVCGGAGVVDAPRRGEWKHRLSVACSHLPLNPRKLKGVISVYENHGNVYGPPLGIVHDDAKRLPRNPDGERLYGERFQCLPSIGVVLSKGSKAVAGWLRTQGVWSGDAESASFDEEQVDRYLAEFESQHPHFLEDCDAMLGGWSVVYPDSNWRLLMNKSLLVTTFRDAEPWLEVYDSGKSFSGFVRVT